MRTLKANRFDLKSVFLCLIFLTSSYIVMSAHLNGYYDNILVILSIVSCVLILQQRILISACVLTLGVFIHETIFIVGFPSVIFVAFVQYLKKENPSSMLKMIVGFISRHIPLIIFPLLAFLVIVVNQMYLDLNVLQNALKEYISKFEFIGGDKNEAVPKAFVTSFFQYIREESVLFWYRIFRPDHLMHIVLPSSIVLSFVWFKIKNIQHRWVVLFLFTLVTVSPLLLHAIAWDTERIWTYPLIAAILSVWGLSELLPQEENAEEPMALLFVFASFIVVMFQFFMLTPLMDQEQERFLTEKRMVLYSPTLMIILYLISRRYSLTPKISTL